MTYTDDLPKRLAINTILEKHDVERPIEKISKEEAEMEYKKKLLFLERQKKELEIMMKMPFKETRIVRTQDGVRKKKAEFKIMDLKDQIA